MLTYVAGLVFSLRTHRGLFKPEYEDERDAGHGRRARSVLDAGGCGDPRRRDVRGPGRLDLRGRRARRALGVLHRRDRRRHRRQRRRALVAVLVARKDKMDLAVNIAIGSSAQIALFVAPVLVIASFFFGPPMSARLQRFRDGRDRARGPDRHTSPDGESNWFEGLQLLAVYLIFGIVFYFA